MKKSTAILLLSCPDQKGIVAAISGFIFQHGGNILYAAQHTARPENILFMRIEWDLEYFSIHRDEISQTFLPLAEQFMMKWDIHFSDYVPQIAIFVSHHIHCFHDLILRHRMGELQADIALVISNHEALEQVAAQYDLTFRHFPITAGNKKQQETKAIEMLKEHNIDLVVLARYMQILSGHFVSLYRNRIINIHHSFLPAFAGSRPYQQAYERGVKIIGATSHYVTEKLDEGPIIAQDVIQITHRDSVDDMVLKGKDIERTVLAQAVKRHLEHRILVYGSRTIIFD
jgi:formyltetrahydrofolate deformylase